jgi:hypothetical protein
MFAAYNPPLDRLLTLGETDRQKEWLDYRQFGLGPEHVPELIGMATDPILTTLPAEQADAWAPMHALRALGQLRDPSAVVPLLERLGHFTDETWDDYFAEDLPPVLAMIGPPAMESMTAFFNDPTKDHFARGWIAEAFYKLSLQHPEKRGECVAILTQQLERAEENGPDLNALIISSLVAIKAVESAGVIEAAFNRGLVDETFDGDWAYTKYDLGLSPTPPPYKRRFHPGSALLPPRNARERAEDRRKKAKADRNRKRRK